MSYENLNRNGLLSISQDTLRKVTPATSRSASGFSDGRRFLIVPVCAILFCSCLMNRTWAAATTAQQALTVTNAWLNESNGAMPFGAARVSGKVDTFNAADGTPAYFVVNLRPTGFVIVAGDDEVEPIVAFVGTGTYSADHATPLGALADADLTQRVKAARAPGVGARGVSVPAQKWAHYQANVVTRGVGSVSTSYVAPLIQSVWNQQSVAGQACYNYYAPPFNTPGNASNYPDGCVATAMAQVIRYHQWPTTGVGTGAFNVYVNNQSQSRNLMGGDGAGGAYDWTNMPLSPSNTSSQAQFQQIGRLCYDAGLAVNMSYSSSGSGATMYASTMAMSTVFKYSNAIDGQNYSGSGLTLSNGLTEMINPNLDAGLPVMLGISGNVGGHAVVCDGYGYNSSTMYHHVNMGWGGVDNVWYNLPTINASYTFTIIYDCVYNIYKSGRGEIVSGRVVDASGAPISGVTITLSNTLTALTNANGIYAFPGLPSNSTFGMIATKTGYSFGTQSATTGSSNHGVATSGNKWGVNFTGTVTTSVPAITSPLTASGIVGVPFTYTIAANASPKSFSATGLPAGLTVNVTTGVISGTPTTAAVTTVKLGATNVVGTGNANLVITVANVSTPVLTSATTAAAFTGTPFTFQITASGNPTKFAATGLPAGLALDVNSGKISGTPTTAGTATVTVSATNAGGTTTGSLKITITADAITIASAPMATPNPASAGQSVAFTVSAKDNAGNALTYAWDFGDGSTGTGATPTHIYGAAGTYAVKVTAKDATVQASGTLSVAVTYPAQPLQLTSLQFKLVSSPANSDSLLMTGNITVEKNWAPNGKTATFTIGGFSQLFTLNTSGAASANNNTRTLTLAGAMSKNAFTTTALKFTISLKSLSLAPIFPNGPPTAKSVTIPISLAIDNTNFTAQLTFTAAATAKVVKMKAMKN